MISLATVILLVETAASQPRYYYRWRLDVFRPVAVRRGYRYGMTMTIDDLEALEVL
jgi:hypothetical protein